MAGVSIPARLSAAWRRRDMATTATEVITEAGSDAEPGFRPHRMTVDRYERLIEAGVFGSKDPVFLWRRRLVERMTPGQPRVFVVSTLLQAFLRLVPDGWYTLQGQPIAVGDLSMPEPDLSVVRGTIRDYLERRPTAARDVALVIEVSDSTLKADSGEVLRAYAAEGVPVYWIVNIPRSRAVVHGNPTGPSDAPDYREHREYGPDDEIPVVLDGVEVGRVAAREILP